MFNRARALMLTSDLRMPNPASHGVGTSNEDFESPPFSECTE